MSVGGSDRNPVELLSEEFLARIRRGEAVTPEEYAAKHPELADEILAVFPALLMMEDLGGETADATASLASGPGAGCSVRPRGDSANSACCAKWAAAAWASSMRPSKNPWAAAWP